ncbi:trypsin-like peptidase domain-containing protein [Herbiconiux sp. CPCC 205716]|uniref:Trypsin-like peptidase domain-containing protein n=1 Tax=Herbiconiux gentiana TaxID=2970912 RepID=A0ABT2GFZ5_9MICO|nr:trypsin-like peptidase domain-containing protein [Herbiconiux gentiana]MCS5715103.1 trypsin-like peptidase domain-containing protein [Herbiconiux gentiana]
METISPRRSVAAVGLVAVVAVVTSALSGCSAGAGPASFDRVQSATLQIEAEGTFADPENGQSGEQPGAGSGFFISSGGLAVTNNHVVAGAGTISVRVGGDDGKEYDARVLGASECLDIAVLQVDGESFPFLGWQKGDITTGEQVYAAGFPLGDPDFTLTQGIVSKNDTSGESAWASLDHVIEHDAKIRPGNSGGPLVNKDGAVVGINYASIGELDYNFAIHRDEAQAVLDRLIDGTDVQSLGVNAQALPVDDQGEPLGVWVSSVDAGSPADAAGVLPGDVLLRMAGTTLATEGTLEQYCDVLTTQGADDTIDVDVYRPGDDTFYRGQFNGTALTAVVVPGADAGSAPTDDGREYATITDDTGVLSVDVPVEWADVDGASFTGPGGHEFLDVRASTDLEAFASSWGTSGVTVSAAEAAVDLTPESIFASFGGYTAQCTLKETDGYSDGVYTGQYQYYTGCGGVSDYVIVVAQPSDASYVMVVSVAIADPGDLPAIEHIMGSFAATFE